MEDGLRSETTVLLERAHSGDASAIDRFLPTIYDELREMAHRQLRRERSDHTLSTTALVHEAYMKLVDQTQVTDRGRAYFFAAAARAMRQILIDYARRHRSRKRGSGRKPLDLDDQQVGVYVFASELVDLDDALERLAALSPRPAQVVECRFFGGLTVNETASALNISPRTVKADWALARAWLYDALRS